MKSILLILLLSLIVYSSSTDGNIIAACAANQIGKKYKTDGMGPEQFDDFGLVYFCMKQVNLPC